MKSICNAVLLGLVWLLPAAVQATDNKITPGLTSIQVLHEGRPVTISRASDKDAEIPKAYRVAGRVCPPFCVEPMHLVPGVETVGELEVLGYLQRISNGEKDILVVDSRTPEWVVRGTIPGSVNIPWNRINIDVNGTFELETEAHTLYDIMHDRFGAAMVDGKWDFSAAKTLVLFCNGAWCPQSSINLKTLAKLGYPAHKLKWYRGGMQSWVTMGLTTI